jgi:hypothetical protein
MDQSLLITSYQKGAQAFGQAAVPPIGTESRHQA